MSDGLLAARCSNEAIIAGRQKRQRKRRVHDMSQGNPTTPVTDFSSVSDYLNRAERSWTFGIFAVSSLSPSCAACGGICGSMAMRRMTVSRVSMNDPIVEAALRARREHPHTFAAFDAISAAGSCRPVRRR
jgi:hypothetical protein